MRIAVLGCGPSGLIAAHAVKISGYNPAIYSRKQKSFIAGAQYLQDHVPGICSDKPDFQITYAKIGPREGYAQKAYGNPDITFCSWDRWSSRGYDAWSLRDAYDHMWGMYSDEIGEIQDINPNFVQALVEKGYDLIISTIPLSAICGDPRHEFHSQPSWIMNDDSPPFPRNTIIYSGYSDTEWHRASRIDERRFFEFGSEQPGATVVRKPQRTTCSCWSGSQVKMVGRYGKWARDVLTIDSFYDTLGLVA